MTVKEWRILGYRNFKQFKNQPKLVKKYLKAIEPKLLSECLADQGAIDEFIDYAAYSCPENRSYLLNILEAFSYWGSDKFDQLVLLSCYELARRDPKAPECETPNDIIMARVCIDDLVQFGPAALESWWTSLVTE